MHDLLCRYGSGLTGAFVLLTAFRLLVLIVLPKSVPTLVLLLFVPLWVSEVLQSFAWFIILSLRGPLNFSLLGLGFIETPDRWIAGVSVDHDRSGLHLRAVHAVSDL